MTDGSSGAMDALNEAESAAFLGVSRWTLASWRTRGGGPHYIKACRRVVYDRADLIAWRNERKRRTTSDE